MRWKPKPKPEPPEDGTTKIIRRFAFLPTKMKNGTIIWLEKYNETHKYHAGGWVGTEGSTYFPSGWYYIRRDTVEPVPRMIDYTKSSQSN